MSKIVLTRVDSRFIHGQVVTKWLQQSGANEILVVSDVHELHEFL
ncbi:PTS sugar transporter subunit IIB, partial [Enterococcus faecalis]